MSRISEAFNKGYCSINFWDSLIITVTIFGIFFVCNFIWFAVTEKRKTKNQ